MWAPLFDQVCQWRADLGIHYNNHPVFKPGVGADSASLLIDRALAAAHAKGIRVFDITVYSLKGLYDSVHVIADNGCSHKKDLFGELDDIARAGEAWVESIKRFNHSHRGHPLKLRVRIPFQAFNIHYFARVVPPFNQCLGVESPGSSPPIVRSQFNYLPFDLCFQNDSAHSACYGASGFDGGYYKAKREDGTYTTACANFANPAMRRAVGVYTLVVLDKLKQILGSGTAIDEVSISLDEGSESSIYVDPPTVISYSNMSYNRSLSFRQKVRFFHARQGLLKEVYTIFAQAVHSRKNTDSSSIKAGIFFQTWPMDGRVRGSHDLYQLLHGTGIDVLHHTMFPFNTYADQLKCVAFSSTIASMLGMEFDTEFTWAHWKTGVPVLEWKKEYLQTQTARNFYSQAQAGFNYSAQGAVYANWTLQELLWPPDHEAWRSIIGRPGPAANYNDEHLQPLLNVTSFDTSSRHAIYISTLGRVQCEENSAGALKQGAPCDYSSYLRWFDDFGLYTQKNEKKCILFNERVDVLTDNMLLSRPRILSGYTKIYFPYETSLVLDSRVHRLLKRLPAGTRQGVKFQHEAGRTYKQGFKGYDELMKTVEVVNEF